jgi:type 2 lantibiotic biosynthesis protein LanM
MNQTILESSRWYNALTLSERSKILTNLCIKGISINRKLAKKQLKKWRSQTQFSDISIFKKRLRADKISIDKLITVLGVSIDSVKKYNHQHLEWLTILKETHIQSTSQNILTLDRMLKDNKYVKSKGLLNIIKPLINQACSKIRSGIESLAKTYDDLPFDENMVIDILIPNIINRLLYMLHRTMTLELNIARLQGTLCGNTPKARYKSFIRQLSQNDIALNLLHEYPVLTRQLIHKLQNWVEFNLEFLANLCKDWSKIKKTFYSNQHPGILVSAITAGDSHNNGRCAIRLQFKSGFQLLYKPRSLAIDQHFQDILLWLNDSNKYLDFRTITILNCDTYGWVEFIQYHGCSTEKEISKFYERLGGYLAVIYAFEVTDLHYENIIAAGEHPVLIDLETIFHPLIHSDPKSRIQNARNLVTQTMKDSVLKSLLLPQRLYLKENYEGLDISGITGKGGQLTPDLMPLCIEEGTDEMRFIRKQSVMPDRHNRPTLKNNEVNPLDYIEFIINGFTNIYRFIREHKNDLLSADGLLNIFVDDPIRVVLRNTRTYALMLLESYHPDVLQNALDRDLLFDRLWLCAKGQPCFVKAIPYEKRDLLNNDIPMFTSRPNSVDLWSSTRRRIKNFFKTSGLENVRKKLNRLDEDDLKKQRWFIRGSFATLSQHDFRQEKHKTYEEPPLVLNHRELHPLLIEAACSIGNRLKELGLRGKRDITWLGLAYKDNKTWSISPIGSDLYNGLPGVALFLAYLGVMTKNKEYKDLAQITLKTFTSLLDINKKRIGTIGAFEGWGGFIHTLNHLGILWNDPKLLTKAKQTVKLITNLIKHDGSFDIISGAAGCIGCLISLYKTTKYNYALKTAIRCGNYLLKKAIKMKRGIGWPLSGMGKKPLSGFSHGAAGFAWALLQLANESGIKKFHKAALASIEYERTLFTPKVGNWKDIREFEYTNSTTNKYQYMTAWCHGAVGIGLARLSALKYVDDPKLKKEINVALDTTLKQGFGTMHNHSLCHGDLGNTELLLRAYQVLKDDKYDFHLRKVMTIILDNVEQHGWQCGIPNGVETPGLMVGLAGIGYQLLRFAEPRHVPSILMLEPPIIPNELSSH